MRLLKVGASLALGKLADDLVDSALGATKARYVGFGVAAGLALFQKGGEFTLVTQLTSNLGRLTKDPTPILNTVSSLLTTQSVRL